jgi:hypothetical protein
MTYCTYKQYVKKSFGFIELEQYLRSVKNSKSRTYIEYPLYFRNQ